LCRQLGLTGREVVDCVAEDVNRIRGPVCEQQSIGELERDERPLWCLFYLMKRACEVRDRGLDLACSKLGRAQLELELRLEFR
jgi:hypothetical protein